MKALYDPAFIKKLKKCNVRIRKSFIEKRLLFAQNPYNPHLNNHPLRDPYQGKRSIDITNDYRAVFEEITVGKELVAYFIEIGTHEELYG